MNDNKVCKKIKLEDQQNQDEQIQNLLITTSDEGSEEQFPQKMSENSVQQNKEQIEIQQKQQKEQQNMNIKNIINDCKSIIFPCDLIFKDTKYVALDCEMVTCKLDQKFVQQVCRVSIVNEDGYILIDQLIQPDLYVTNYITKITGLNQKDLIDQPKLKDLKPKLISILQNKMIIGHNIYLDLKVLELIYLQNICIDIQNIPKFQNKKSNKKNSLKWLTNRFINVDIQKGKHCSIEDSRATMALFKFYLQTKIVVI